MSILNFLFGYITGRYLPKISIGFKEKSYEEFGEEFELEEDINERYRI